MPNLYRRLFTYRERPNRSPLEDFLTEALADLMNRLPSSELRRTVCFLLGDRSDLMHELKKVWPAESSARWKTQSVIAGVRPDLVMEVDGRPILVVENKIGAGFQQHRSNAEQATGRGSQNQLATYGQWLALETDSTWGGAIVLLTHWTPAPSDFATDIEKYACRYRAVVRWSDLSHWFARLIRSQVQTTTDWMKLTEELVGFLKEENMDSELASSRDLAALEIYVASADRVRNSVEQIWNSARSIWRPICQQREIPLEHSTEYGCVWKYRYLLGSDISDSYVAVGLRYPDLSIDYLSTLALDSKPFLFVELASDGDTGLIGALKMPHEWLSMRSLKLSKKSLGDFSTDPDSFVKEAGAWVRERVEEVAVALTSRQRVESST